MNDEVGEAITASSQEVPWKNFGSWSKHRLLLRALSGGVRSLGQLQGQCGSLQARLRLEMKGQ